MFAFPFNAGHDRNLTRGPARVRGDLLALLLGVAALSGCAAGGHGAGAPHAPRAVGGVLAARAERAPLVGSPQAQAGSAQARALTARAHGLFSPRSIWNRPLAADAPVDPQSAELVAQFDQQVAQEETERRGPWINTNEYSVPILTVSATQPTVPVRLVHAPEPALSSAWSAVPLPSNAQPAAGTDANLVVWQPSTDRMWEFWQLAHTEGGWSASWGGAIRHVSRNPGVYGPEAWPGAQPWWGASASSLALAGGVITIEDLRSGTIDHALAISIPEVRAGVFASPARRTDGTSRNPLALPEGAHLRLDPNLNIASLSLPPLVREMALAAQRYGIVVRDFAGAIVFSAQDPTPTGSNPYLGPGGYFEGKYPDDLLAGFPWSHLQVLQLELHSSP
jgi:hypothetical protein